MSENAEGPKPQKQRAQQKSSRSSASADNKAQPSALPAQTDLLTLSLKAALEVASEHWADRPGEVVMTTMATKCVEDLEAAGYGVVAVGYLQKRHAIRLLKLLRRRGLSPKSVASYYGAFRRMLSLNGFETPAWPKPPTPPRKTRDPLSKADSLKIIEWLDAKGWQPTADVARVLLATGLRINVEALSEAHLDLQEGEQFDVLHVVGKGGHERFIPVVSEDAREVFRSKERMEAMRGVSYSGHIQRWRKAVASCGVKSRLATPHAMRHGYATEVLARSGGNLVMVQELLGHADPGTTARYLSVDLSAKAKALTNPGDASECTSTDSTASPPPSR